MNKLSTSQDLFVQQQWSGISYSDIHKHELHDQKNAKCLNFPQTTALPPLA